MKEISATEYRTRLRNMLAFFTDYCNSVNISFFVFYGSLIGTMRHQGFIPWDDDIDITLPRPDYDRLIAGFNMAQKRYRIVSMHTNNCFTAPLAKIIDTETYLVQHYGFKERVKLGVYIDVFILDGFSNNEIDSNLHMKRCIELKNYWSHANHGFNYIGSSFIKNVLRRIYYFPVICKGTNYYLKQIDKNARSIDYSNSSFVGNAAFPVYGYREIFNKSDFSIPTFGEFEGIKVPIPNGYDKILTQLYGEWRIMPPLEERQSHHDFVCYLIK